MQLRGILFSLIVAGSIHPLLAQSPTGIPEPAPQTLPPATHDSRTQLPPLLQSRITAAQTRSLALLQSGKLGQPLVVSAQNSSVCYAMRSYKFAQEDPSSDRTTYKGASTCDPAKDSHLQGIAGPALR